MTRRNTPIVIVKGGRLDILGDDVVIRGYLEESQLQNLKVDNYQRGVRSEGKLAKMVKAVLAGKRLPDGELSMRGDNYRELKNGEFELHDPVFIVDAQQRANAIIIACQQHLGLKAHLGVVIHVNKTYEWEQERFEDLNLNREDVKRSKLLANRRDKHPMIASIFGLTNTDPNCAIRNRVTWEQDAKVGELLNSWFLARLIIMLHSHKVPLRGSDFEDHVAALDEIAATFGVQNARGNVKTFFNAIDESWNIRDITYKAGAVHMRKNFLTMLARVVCNHHNFWRAEDEKVLIVDKDMVERWKRFKPHEPHVANVLTKEASRYKELHSAFVEAVDYKRRNKLRPRKVEYLHQSDEDEETDRDAA